MSSAQRPIRAFPGTAEAMTEPRDASATDSADLVEASTGGSLGLPQATSLVLGTIIGVGVFNLPDRWPPMARSAWSRSA